MRTATFCLAACLLSVLGTIYKLKPQTGDIDVTMELFQERKNIFIFIFYFAILNVVVVANGGLLSTTGNTLLKYCIIVKQDAINMFKI